MARTTFAAWKYGCGHWIGRSTRIDAGSERSRRDALTRTCRYCPGDPNRAAAVEREQRAAGIPRFDDLIAASHIRQAFLSKRDDGRAIRERTLAVERERHERAERAAAKRAAKHAARAADDGASADVVASIADGDAAADDGGDAS